MKYIQSHEWVVLQGETATVGISNYAQEQLSDVVYVELPAVGDTITKGERFMSIESVKSASDIHAPLSGQIIEINEQLNASPELVNQSPEEQGWLVKLTPKDLDEYSQLIPLSDYLAMIKS